jgi:hypothetical protein
MKEKEADRKRLHRQSSHAHGSRPLGIIGNYERVTGGNSAAISCSHHVGLSYGRQRRMPNRRWNCSREAEPGAAADLYVDPCAFERV